MVIHHQTVNGFDEFNKFVENLEKESKPQTYFMLFTGSKNADGKSWCPDCVEADPIIETVLESLTVDTNFVTVTVGDRNTWKDPNCRFRKDARTKLMVIPTLVKWKKPQKLEGDKCAKKEIVEMMFIDYDEDSS